MSYLYHMECPLSKELQDELGVTLETIDNKSWYYSDCVCVDDYPYTVFLMFKLNRYNELVGEFQYMGYVAVRSGLPSILDVMARMEYPPAIAYARKQIIDELLQDLP